MEQQIKRILLDLGADVCGIANVEKFADAPEGFHPKDIYSDCKSVVVFACRLPKGLSFVNPRIVYKHHGEINMAKLDQITLTASSAIEDLGAVAVPLPCDGPYEYWDSERMEGRGILSMRHAAGLAGIGSLGKSTLLINKRYGNLLNIGAILTNLDLESDSPSEELCIDNCFICIDSCPAKALDGITVNQKKCRENTYSETTARGFGVTNCNNCRVKCPMGLGIEG